MLALAALVEQAPLVLKLLSTKASARRRCLRMKVMPIQIPLALQLYNHAHCRTCRLRQLTMNARLHLMMYAILFCLTVNSAFKPDCEYRLGSFSVA